MATLKGWSGTCTVTDGTTATTVHTAILGIRSFTLGDGSANPVDSTTIESTTMEYLQGLPDFGSFTFEMIFDPLQAGQAQLIAAKQLADVRQFILTLAGGAICTFFGSVLQVNPSVSDVDGLWIATVNVKISGSLVWS